MSSISSHGQTPDVNPNDDAFLRLGIIRAGVVGAAVAGAAVTGLLFNKPPEAKPVDSSSAALRMPAVPLAPSAPPK